MMAFDAYTDALMTSEELMQRLAPELFDENIDEAIEKYADLDDYQKEVAFFYVLGKYVTLFEQVEEFFEED